MHSGNYCQLLGQFCQIPLWVGVYLCQTYQQLKMKRQNTLLSALLLVAFFATTAFISNSKEEATDSKSMELLNALEKENGGWETLLKMKDVEFNYEYKDFGKKAKDVSVERYVFANETSWASYDYHKVNVMPTAEGKVVQCLMNGKPEISLNGEKVNDPKAIGGTAFLRSANYYWFTMMYKLKDPGVNHQYMGTEVQNGIAYDKMKVTHSNTGKEANDEYILYFNPKTHLVDFFYFSLPAMGVKQTVLRMELSYEKIQGVYVNTVRKGIFPNEKGEYNPGGEYTYSNVKFNNNFTKDDFSL